jgi:RNA polymerase sigma factor (sigma-70 family)
MSDLDLLQQYAQKGSEEAFATLVNRHLNFVYATALRQVKSPQMAEEVAQSVFMSLARNSNTMKPETVLTAWLYRVTRNATTDLIRGESRRQAREQTAFEISNMKSDSAGWAHVEPFLDEALETLEETDRGAILLRYFENKSLREVGETLGTSEDAAQKRVSRAVEQLRACFSRRGVALSATSLIAALCAQATQAAPSGLSGAITTAATLAGPPAGAAAFTTATKAIAMTTLQKTLIAAVIAGTLGTGIYGAHEVSSLRTQVQTLQQSQADPGQTEQLTRERDDATRQLAALREESGRSNRNNTELLKLRAEVARLRSDSHELAQLKAGNPNDATESSAKSWVNRVSLLKQRLEQNPSAKIPELKFVTEQDWLNASKGELNTEADYRRALSALRAAGENKVAAMFKKALTGYMQTSGGQFPTDLGQLQPHFDSPVDDAILQRWEVAPASTVKSLGMGGDVIITQRAPVDEVFDTRFGIGPNGTGSTDFLSREVAGTMGPVWEAYRAAHNGQWPNDTSQLLPYATTPEQQASLQKLILRGSGS